MVRLTQILFRLLPLTALLLSACASVPPGERAPVIDAGQPAGTGGGRAPAPAATADTPEDGADVVVIPLERSSSGASPAVASLLGQAEAASRERDWSAAAVSLERGLRIEPRNPVLWNRLAEVRLQQGQYRQAEQLAAKSSSLAGDDSLLQARNWRLIARARRHQGDERGAAEAERRADSLR
ncbi:tetratricopeptide repeat protein [Thiohalobacter thiocyanaticus]|uniref:Uncharacterized protein n=1 Tax=Thiohalobacter thiocyanaticus TaxID=585455 RepID=A0A426QFW2_9GAMM|nr:tetratricopeptide repeat protein [Thiohalobacter thiocyanaticus]RRQ20640.1 hypothetical protein D6C00_00675 [Thiohalobacter thiocyanaticus]